MATAEEVAMLKRQIHCMKKRARAIAQATA